MSQQVAIDTAGYRVANSASQSNLPIAGRLPIKSEHNVDGDNLSNFNWKSIPRVLQIAFGIPGSTNWHKAAGRIRGAHQQFTRIQFDVDPGFPKLPTELVVLTCHLGRHPRLALVSRHEDLFDFTARSTRWQSVAGQLNHSCGYFRFRLRSADRCIDRIAIDRS